MKRALIAGAVVVCAATGVWLTNERKSEVQDRSVTCVTRAFDSADVAANQAFLMTPASMSLGITVDVYFHVITGVDEKGRAIGHVTADEIDDQMATLQAAFRGTGIGYVLRAIDYKADSAWFEMTAGSSEEADAKTALRRGGAASLNVYTIGHNRARVTAWGSMPRDYRTAKALDGVVVPYWTLPGVTSDTDIRGHLLIHEVGHWLGLAHTSAGGCVGTGDDITDTTAEKRAVYGCPKPPDYSCGLTQHDPVHNYMDNTDDTCTNHFTPEQHQRMIQWLNARLTY